METKALHTFEAPRHGAGDVCQKYNRDEEAICGWPRKDHVSDYEGFLAEHSGTRHVFTIDLDNDFEESPFIVVKHGSYVTVINPMAQKDHLCVDVHPFVDEKDARAGVFGMEDGFRASLDDEQVNGFSHRWPAAKLVAVLVGEQEEK